ncbi:uncharacterized protein CELE_T02E1.1 [Caenorhabditis elegans]|uniref:SPE-12 n=1 Tax=Caenorhabditis elegans TaxID=6239 RepID=G5EEF3_CAEEL|nr:Uncharacterized protein CELE_T02E1.1 [Caenorhabditis elegans]AAB02238.1 SPE-12 [Caenorhabditis elegans]CAB04665.1 Uncharacterized protein CELE_T02E1.1 [Caenorhabditis elegans]|eukprot:NP_492242.1 Uncharacterized protein CELE_T02E1.1 [Caenorhabditis elegans]
MNTSTFYIVLLCFLSRNLLNAEHSEEKNNQDLEDRRYKMFGNETDDKRCIHGDLISITSKTFYATEKYYYTECHTRAPSCGFQMMPIMINGLNTSNKVVRFGCFPTRDILGNQFFLNKRYYSNSFDGIYSMFDYFAFENTGIADYLIYYKPTAEELKAVRYVHENRWVENPQEFIVQKKNESSAEAHSDGLNAYFRHKKITPLMIIYILFICFSVIFKLIWLVHTAWKNMKQGYAPIAKMSEVKEDFERTVEDLD